MTERNPDLPVLKACAGTCASWLEDGDGEIVGQQELGTNLGLYADVRMCYACAAKFKAARGKPAVEVKSGKKDAAS